MSNAKVLINLWKQYPAELLTRCCYQTCIILYVASICHHRKLRPVNKQTYGSLLMPNGDCLKAAISANCFEFYKICMKVSFSFSENNWYMFKATLGLTGESAPLDLFMFWIKWLRIFLMFVFILLMTIWSHNLISLVISYSVLVGESCQISEDQTPFQSVVHMYSRHNTLWY